MRLESGFVCLLLCPHVHIKQSEKNVKEEKKIDFHPCFSRFLILARLFASKKTGKAIQLPYRRWKNSLFYVTPIGVGSSGKVSLGGGFLWGWE
jgi:hypothetical protein